MQRWILGELLIPDDLEGLDKEIGKNHLFSYFTMNVNRRFHSGTIAVSEIPLIVAPKLHFGSFMRSRELRGAL